MSSSKQYGLIISEKNKTQQAGFRATRNVFGDDSESEEDTKKPVLLRPSHNINRQAKISQEKAIMEDPTVYQYDEIYDSMSSQKEEKKVKSKEEKKPRYIENLLKSANKRKIENERRMERKIQLEREKEGDEFADKEVFVTSAYKKKLEELRLEEEREKREEYLESIGDVTKQSDLGGFYRHLYEQKLGADKLVKDKPEEEQKIPEEEQKTPEDSPKKDNAAIFKTKRDDTTKKPEMKRNYRKRQADKKDLSEGEIDGDSSGDEINRLNLDDIRAKKMKKNEQENADADSDFSIDSSSSDDDEGEKKVKKKNKQYPKTEEGIKSPKENNVEAKVSEKANDDNGVNNNDLEKESSPATPPPEPKPKIDIWKKRTVGAVFDEALRRYYERKAARGL